MSTIPFLHLDCIETEQYLMKLLPIEVATRYQALPVSTDGNCVTVAMASPKDTVACAAVTSALGKPVCLVQADPQEINQRLAALWQENPAPRLRILLWPSTKPNTETLDTFVQLLLDLLDADLVLMDIHRSGARSFNDLRYAIKEFSPDLIIFQAQNIAHFKRMLFHYSTQTQVGQLPALLFVPEIPRWPLENILMALPDGDTRVHSAVNWTIQLARLCQSSVTVLPLLPPVPSWYGSFIRHSTQALLAAEDPMGQKMRLIAKRLSEDKINGAFKLRDGEPLDQLQNELQSSDPDLVIFASTPHSCLRYWMTENIVTPLLWGGNRMVLIANNSKVNKK